MKTKQPLRWSGNQAAQAEADAAFAKLKPKAKPSPKAKAKRGRNRKPPRKWSNYGAYLRSEVWRRKRAQVLTRAGGRCETCREPGKLQVRHKRYSPWGAEPIADLEALCPGCFANSLEGEVVGAADPLTREFLSLGL